MIIKLIYVPLNATSIQLPLWRRVIIRVAHAAALHSTFRFLQKLRSFPSSSAVHSAVQRTEDLPRNNSLTIIINCCPKATDNIQQQQRTIRFATQMRRCNHFIKVRAQLSDLTWLKNPECWTMTWDIAERIATFQLFCNLRTTFDILLTRYWQWRFKGK